MELMSLAISSFDRGQVSSVPVTLLPPEVGCRRLYNFDFSGIPGFIRKRPGTAQVLGSTSQPIRAIYEYKKSSTGDTYKLASAGSDLVYWDAETSSWATIKSGLSSDKYPDFLTFADKVVHVNGQDSSFLWDGTSVTTPADFPICKYMTQYKLRIFAAGILGDPLLLKACHPGDPTVWDADDDTKKAFAVYVSPDDGQVLTGLLALSDCVLLGKETSLSILVGTTRESFSIFTLDDNVGMGSHFAAKRIKDTAFFPDQKGNIYSYSYGAGLQRLSWPVQDLIETVNPVYIDLTRAFVWDGDQYVVSLPTGEDGSGRLTLAYDTVEGRWREWSFPVGTATRVTDDSEGDIYFVRPGSNTVWRLTPGLLRDGDDAIIVQADTVELHCGGLQRYKEFSTLFLNTWCTNTEAEVIVYCRCDKRDWEYLARATVPPVEDDYHTIQVPVGRRARLIEFRIENSKADENLGILSAKVTYNVEGEE